MHVTSPSTTTIVTAVSVTTAATTLAAKRRMRSGLLIFNPTAVVLYVKFGTGASSSDYSFKLTAGQTYESGGFIYLGPITGALASGSGTVQITEGVE